MSNFKIQRFNLKTFQGLILALQNYWSEHGCTIIQPLDMEVGAGTSHPVTCLRAIGPEPIFISYVQSSRRPSDGRYGKNPNRLQCYYQFQTIIKPSPDNIQELYFNSLKEIDIDPTMNDIRFIEDNWKNPTLGACGSGWEVWLNGMEITQFTYFQRMGGLECKPVMGEITYGLERISMHLQEVNNIYDLVWNDNSSNYITYGDLFHQNEVEQSYYNFEYSNIEFLFSRFDQYEQEARHLLFLEYPLILPAYECVLKASHIFNLLDARRALSATERECYIIRIRNLTKSIAQKYLISREEQDFPMCKKSKKN